MADATAEWCARALFTGWIAGESTCDELKSDRGRQVESSLWAAFNQLLGSSKARTTSYHPQGNGLVERLHRPLKASLKARLTKQHWVDELPIVLLGIRASYEGDINCSPAELVYGSALRLAREFLDPTASPQHNSYAT